MILRFSIRRVKPDAEGFDWQVSPSKATAAHIATIIAQHIADGTNGYSLGDDKANRFKSRKDAEQCVRSLRRLYGEDHEKPDID